MFLSTVLYIIADAGIKLVYCICFHLKDQTLTVARLLVPGCSWRGCDTFGSADMDVRVYHTDHQWCLPDRTVAYMLRLLQDDCRKHHVYTYRLKHFNRAKYVKLVSLEQGLSITLKKRNLTNCVNLLSLLCFIFYYIFIYCDTAHPSVLEDTVLEPIKL